jgi:hypothetical protein
MGDEKENNLVMPESVLRAVAPLKAETVDDLIKCGAIRRQSSRGTTLSIHDDTLDLSAIEVAELAKISKRHVKRLCDAGDYPGAHKGKSTTIKDSQKGWLIPLASAIKVHDLSQSAVLAFFIARSRPGNR